MSLNRKKKLAIYTEKLKVTIDLFSQNKFEEAEKEARAAIKLYSKDTAAHYLLADALASQDKFKEAEKEARHAVKINPNDAEAHYIFSKILIFQDKFEEAEKEVKDAIKIDPSHAEAHEIFSRILYHQNKFDDAEKEVRVAIKNCTDRTHHITLSKILIAQHKRDEAEKEAKEAVRLDPSDVYTHICLADILCYPSKYEEAEKEAREAVRLDPSDVNAHICLAEVLSFKDVFEEAEKEARYAVKINPSDVNAHICIADILSSQKKFEEAEEEAKEAVKLDPNDARAHNYLARILSSRDKFEEAEKEARTAIKLDPKFDKFHDELAGILYLQDKIEDAELAAIEAIRLDNMDAEAHDHLARILQSQRKFVEAEIEAKEAMRYCPGISHRQTFISILLDLNNHIEAETKARELIKLYSDDSASHLILAEVLYTIGKIEEADKELSEAMDLGDEKSKCENFMYVGTLLLSLGKFEAASSKLENAINCYKRQGDTRNAIKSDGFKKWVAASEKWKEGDVEDSILHYSEAKKSFGSIGDKHSEYMETLSQFCSIDSELQGIIDSTDHLIIKDKVPYFLKKAEKIVIKIKKEPERSLVEARITYYRVILQFLQEVSSIDDTSNIIEKEIALGKFEKDLENAYLIFKKYNSVIGMAGYHSFMLQIINAKDLFRKLKNEDVSKFYTETQNWLDIHFPRIKETLSLYDGNLSNEIGQYFMEKSRMPKIPESDGRKHKSVIEYSRPEIPVRVLIFGPGEESEDYSLRVDIKKVLEDLKFEVLFPEDHKKEIDLKNWLAKNNINLTYKQEIALSSLTARELILAENCDRLIILLMKPGAISEFSQFYTDSRVASKIRVLIPMDLYKSDSYVRAGPLQMFEERFKHVYPFENADQAKYFILQISRTDMTYDYLRQR